MRITLPEGTAPSSIDMQLRRSHITLGLRNADPVLSGELVGPVDTDSSFWTTEVLPNGVRQLYLRLEKVCTQ